MAKKEFLNKADKIREEAKKDAFSTDEYKRLTARIGDVPYQQGSVLKRIRDNFAANFIQLYLVNKLADALEKAESDPFDSIYSEIEKTVGVDDLEEIRASLRNLIVQLNVKIDSTCEVCNGTGDVSFLVDSGGRDMDDVHECKTCNGTGKYEIPRSIKRTPED